LSNCCCWRRCCFVRSDFLINQMGDALHDLYVPEASLYLQRDPPDLDGLNGWMQRTFDDRSPKGFAETGFSAAA
jgi:hypothetical protein